MKIRQHGTIPNWELNVACKRCNAVITLETPEDMHARSHPTGKMDGAYVDYGPTTYHFICPECKQENKIAAQKIREDIRQKIKIKK